MKTAFRRLLAAALAFSLSACMLVGGDALVTPGGAEDFPNTVTTLGRIAFDDISSSGQWGGTQDVPPPVMPEIGGIDSLNVTPPLSRRPALAKASAEGGTRDTTIDINRAFEFFLARRLYVYLSHETDLSRRTDTVVCRYLGVMPTPGQLAEKADSIQAVILADPLTYLLPLDARGVIRSKTSSAWQTYRLTNLDARGAMDWAEYVTFEVRPDGSTSRKRVRVYGPDSTYARANAVPEEYEILVRAAAGDTLEWTFVRDADWDRVLWTDSTAGVVDLYRRVFSPAGQPEPRRHAVYMRAGLHRTGGGDSLAQLYYHDQRWLHNGRVATFEFRGAGDSGTTLSPNDSARMTVDTIFALADSTIRYTAVYNLRLGASVNRMQDHALRDYKVSKYWRRGPVFSTLSEFMPDSLVSLGQAGFEGTMNFVAAYANGDAVQTQGRVSATGLRVTLTQIKEGVLNVYCADIERAAGNPGESVLAGLVPGPCPPVAP